MWERAPEGDRVIVIRRGGGGGRDIKSDTYQLTPPFYAIPKATYPRTTASIEFIDPSSHLYC